MMKKGKKFDKKNSVTFDLVHRSQQDPLINYENAPQSVLVEQSNSRKRKEEQRKYGVYYDDDYDYMQHLKNVKDREQEYEISEVYDKATKKFVRFDDLHEKRSNQDEAGPSGQRLQLPSSLFESGIKESVGMLNKAAAVGGFQPDWDLDIVRTLTDEYGFEDSDNEIDDDFVVQAQEGEVEKINFEELENEEIDPVVYEKLKIAKQNQSRKQMEKQTDRNDWKEQIYEEDEPEEDQEDVGSDCVSIGSENELSDDFNDRYTYRSLGSKSQFTNYSMSSSILPRNQGLTDLDERFENFYLKDYADDTEIGDLIAEQREMAREPGEESQDLDKKILDQIVNQGFMFEKNEKIEINTDLPKETILAIAELQNAQESEDEETEEIVLQAGMGKNDFDSRWDCESVLSTYSNLYNHPKLICEQQPRKIRINAKTGIPEGVIGSQLSAKALKQLDKINMMQADVDTQSIRSATSMMSQLTVRNEQETPEERRQRKKNLKEYMKERRMEKKMNKEAFKAEHLRQQKEYITNRTVGAMKMV